MGVICQDCNTIDHVCHHYDPVWAGYGLMLCLCLHREGRSATILPVASEIVRFEAQHVICCNTEWNRQTEAQTSPALVLSTLHFLALGHMFDPNALEMMQVHESFSPSLAFLVFGISHMTFRFSFSILFHYLFVDPYANSTLF